MGEHQPYDLIGQTYAEKRRTDPRILSLVVDAVGDAATIVNVGAGTGSYEPSDRQVVALEPSWTMISQRTPESAPVVQGIAECLPFASRSFDVAIAMFTMHHWSDPLKGLSELARVAGRVVIGTIDTGVGASFWLTEYFPSIAEWDARHFISVEATCARLVSAEVVPIPIPHDCRDGFLAAYWRRPEAYLNHEVRASISTFSLIDRESRNEGLRRLERDLESGAWRRKHERLMESMTIDAGYRLIVAASP